MKNIALSIPNFNGKELEYVQEAIESEWVSTAGPFVSQFEDDISDYLGVLSAVACQSGTSGIHLALEIAGVREGIDVIVPTATFIAAVNPVKYTRGNPIFVDCDDSLNMDLNKLESFCENQCHIKNEVLINNSSGNQIKAIIIVHIFGNPADMEKLMKIAKKYHLKVIEDATEALGSYYEKGKYKGKFAGTIGDFGIYSFNGNKIITTGGGGMLVAKDAEKLKKAKYLSTQAKDDKLFYCHNEIGYNYRMTNLQAALGVAQLEKLENYIAIKKKNYLRYKEGIKEIDGISILNFNEGVRPNYWFYSLIIDEEKYGINRNKLIELLKEKGIQTRPLWGLINKQKPYKNDEAYMIDKANHYEKNLLNIPCSVNLKKEEIDFILHTLQDISKTKE